MISPFVVRRMLVVASLGVAGCLFTPSQLTSQGRMNEQEFQQLALLAKRVALCKPIQSFPFDPCVEGDVVAAVPVLLKKIRIRRMDGEFECNGAPAVGCWNSTSMTLSYDTSGKTHDPDGILDHELLHMLLWAVDDSRHRCSIHDFDGNGVWDCYE